LIKKLHFCIGKSNKPAGYSKDYLLISFDTVNWQKYYLSLNQGLSQ